MPARKIHSGGHFEKMQKMEVERKDKKSSGESYYKSTEFTPTQSLGERVKPKALFCWSGGKDSSFALYKVLQENQFEVTALFTTINENFRRVSMHGIKEELIEIQAESIGLPLLKMYVKEGSNEEYEKNMESFLLEQKKQGIEYVIFGDIFLEDLRAYRDANLAKVGMKGLYPLWKQNTIQLAHEFIELGFKTRLCCINDAYLTDKEAGILFDLSFLSNLPIGVDPCGENGEFHTFCYEGPIFKKPLKVRVGEKVYKPLEIKTSSDQKMQGKTLGFWFCEFSHE